MPAYDYQLEDEPHARGGQGEVYFGTRSDGALVAVKVAGVSATAALALQREIASLRQLEAAGVPFVVPCLDTWEYDGRLAMVMPRYAQTLRAWLDEVVQTPTAASLGEAFDHCIAIARTLARVHRLDVDGKRVVHRDVKPENIFLDAEGQLWLGDFGGAMAIEGLRAVELALFGTPMWAPFDQILPGKAIPDPTWDTYALCVLLYAALTGARPAYQADPRELLTAQGRELWEVARKAIEAQGDHQRTLRLEFANARKSTAASDLVDLTGRSALNEADKRVLFEGIDRLCDLAAVEPKARPPLRRGLWSLLSRGLSPVSHPSPPNRYRDADELAAHLSDLRDLTMSTGTPSPPKSLEDLLFAGPMDGPDIPIDGDTTLAPPAPEAPGMAAWVLGAVVVSALLIGGVVGANIAWQSLRDTLGWSAAPVVIPATAVSLDGLEVEVTSFSLDAWEVTGDRWADCVEEGACPHRTGALAVALPVTALSLDDAATYCAWAEGRLPTEAEWRAAAGPDLWPWGEDSPTCAHANAMGCSGQLEPPGGRRAGRSPQQVHDLAGNAWEWVRVGKGGTGGVLLGGGVDSPASEIGKRARRVAAPGASPPLAGVRCAYDLDDS